MFSAVIAAIASALTGFAGFVYTKPLRRAQTEQANAETVKAKVDVAHAGVDALADINDRLEREVTRLNTALEKERQERKAENVKCETALIQQQNRIEELEQSNYRLRGQLERAEQRMNGGPSC